MALFLATYPGSKQSNGAYSAPANIDPSQVNKGTDANHVSITGLNAGDSVAFGQYFYGLFNDEANKFVSPLKPVPAFEVLEDASTPDAKAIPTSNGAVLSTGE